MKPILYPVNYSVFVGNGIGLLNDATYCKCTEVLNGSYELELKIPKNGQHAYDIAIDCVLKVKPNYLDDPQLFRIYSVEKDYDGYVTVKAAHITYDTCGIPVKPFTSESLSDAVDHMNNDRIILHGTRFVLNADFSSEGTLEVKSPASFRSILGGSDSSITSVYGGEYHYDNYTINLLEKRGADRGICFRYGKNITNFEQETNSEELYSAVIGFWKKSGSDNEEDTIVYGNIIECEGEFPYDKIYVLDATNEIKTENDAVPTVEQVDEAVENYIAQNGVGIPSNKMKIDYADNDKIIKVCLGDRVGVLFPEYKINAIARCTKCVFDCLLERNESIEIGEIVSDISDTISDMSKKLSNS